MWSHVSILLATLTGQRELVLRVKTETSPQMESKRLQNASLLSKVAVVLSVRESAKVVSVSQNRCSAAPARSLKHFLHPLLFAFV